MDCFGEELAGRIDGLGNRVDSLDNRLTSRIDSLDRSLNHKIDGLDRRLSRQFTWLVGIQIAVLLTVIASLSGPNCDDPHTL